MTTHKHTNNADKERGPFCYSGSVAVYPHTHENRGAHGGIKVIEVCDCGAERPTNVNAGAVEYGVWRMPEKEEPIYVDAAQLGDRWRGSDSDLRVFAGILSDVTGRDIRVAFSRNGGDTSGVSEADWNRAVDLHSERNPVAWA